MTEPELDRGSLGGRYSDEEVAANEERDRLAAIAQWLDLRRRTVEVRNRWAAEGRGTASLQRTIDRCDTNLLRYGYSVGQDD